MARLQFSIGEFLGSDVAWRRVVCGCIVGCGLAAFSSCGLGCLITTSSLDVLITPPLERLRTASRAQAPFALQDPEAQQ